MDRDNTKFENFSIWFTANFIDSRTVTRNKLLELKNHLMIFFRDRLSVARLAEVERLIDTRIIDNEDVKFEHIEPILRVISDDVFHVPQEVKVQLEHISKMKLKHNEKLREWMKAMLIFVKQMEYSSGATSAQPCLPAVIVAASVSTLSLGQVSLQHNRFNFETMCPVVIVGSATSGLGDKTSGSDLSFGERLARLVLHGSAKPFSELMHDTQEDMDAVCRDFTAVWRKYADSDDPFAIVMDAKGNSCIPFGGSDEFLALFNESFETVNAKVVASLHRNNTSRESVLERFKRNGFYDWNVDLKFRLLYAFESEFANASEEMVVSLLTNNNLRLEPLDKSSNRDNYPSAFDLAETFAKNGWGIAYNALWRFYVIETESLQRYVAKKILEEPAFSIQQMSAALTNVKTKGVKATLTIQEYENSRMDVAAWSAKRGTGLGHEDLAFAKWLVKNDHMSGELALSLLGREVREYRTESNVASFVNYVKEDMKFLAQTNSFTGHVLVMLFVEGWEELVLEALRQTAKFHDGEKTAKKACEVVLELDRPPASAFKNSRYVVMQILRDASYGPSTVKMLFVVYATAGDIDSIKWLMADFGHHIDRAFIDTALEANNYGGTFKNRLRVITYINGEDVD